MLSTSMPWYAYALAKSPDWPKLEAGEAAGKLAGYLVEADHVDDVEHSAGADAVGGGECAQVVVRRP